MGYYQMGDYGTGGYYQGGDPGLLSFVKRAFKKAPAIATGFATGGLLGAGTAAFGLGGKSKAVPVSGTGGINVAAAGMPMVIGPAAGAAMRGLGKGALMKIGKGMLAGAAGATVIRMVTDKYGNECCPTGYHPAKDGSQRCVRNRRMNVANPAALRRSMRRVQGFEKLAKRTISFTKRVRMKPQRKRA